MVSLHSWADQISLSLSPPPPPPPNAFKIFPLSIQSNLCAKFLKGFIDVTVKKWKKNVCWKKVPQAGTSFSLSLSLSLSLSHSRVLDLASCFSLAKKVTMFSWVRVLNSAGTSWGRLDTVASSRMFTLFSAVRSLMCEGQRSMVLWCRWPTASLSSSQPKLIRGAVTANPLETSLCLRISIFLVARPKRQASISPFSESMEVSHSTGRREPLTTC